MRPGRFSLAAKSLQLAGLSWALVQLVSCSPAGNAKSSASRHTIERLYSLPSLIGTAPRGLTWSPNGQRLAFLWNDAGGNFLDVWVVGVDSPEWPARWTRLERPSVQPKEDPYETAVEMERVERDAGVSGILWHPDGERIVFSRGGDLFVARQEQEPEPLVDNVRQARFSPAGDRLAFLRAGDIWTSDANGGAVERLTQVAGNGVRVASYSWSPNGDRLVAVMADSSAVKERLIPDYLTEETSVLAIRRAFLGEPSTTRRVGVVSASGGTMRWLSLAEPEPPMIFDVRWSPDGRHLAVDTSDLYAKDRRLLRVDPLGREPSLLLARDDDPENETFYFWRAEWSRDGERVFFLSDRDTDYHVWAVAPGGGEAKAWTSGDWAVSHLMPADNGLYVVGNRGRAEERHLFFVAGPGAEPVRVTTLPGTHAPVVASNGGWAGSVRSADDSPPDLYLVDLSTGDEKSDLRVTRSPLDEFDDYIWVTPEYVTFPSHIDGTTLHGRLTLPPDFDASRTYPAILGSVYTDSVRNQWGGRTAHPTWGLDQYLAQEGYVLLNVDMRGSWGRGREHRRGIRLDYGGMDIEDLESGVRYLETLGYVDMERVGIWGSSYGGLMTTMSLFRKPGLYAAGIAGAPATNVWHALPAQMTVLMRPQDQHEEYVDSSPFLHAHGLEDPLMIIHGMRDRVVLYKDSLVLVQRLLQMDKDVELVTLPNAGHGWDNEGLAQTRFAFRQMVEYFDRHLEGQGTATVD